MMQVLSEHHREHPTQTVPTLLCSDIGHGLVDRNGTLLWDNWQLFEHAIPFTAEFHLKNTDGLFHSTFGFSPEEMGRGIVELTRLKDIIARNEDRFPVDHLVGYLELAGPKLGRDYSDHKLEGMISESVASLQRHLL